MSNLRDLPDVRRIDRPLIPSAPKALATRLVGVAYAQLVSNLEGYGNSITDQHRRALLKLLFDMAGSALGRTKGRLGYPLPCGAGKTQAAVCFAYAIIHLDVPISVAITSSRIDNLAEIHEELLKLGVSSEDVGIIHSDEDHPLKVTQGNHLRRIMLVTHARLKGTDRMPQYAYYRDRLRDLFIWDEGLVTSDHWSISMRPLSKAVGSYKELLADDLDGDLDDTKAEAYRYLGTAKDLLQSELIRQEENPGTDPRRIQLPDWPEGYTGSDLKIALEEDHRDECEVLFDHPTRYVRALRVRTLRGFAWFEVVLPEELDTMTILDASLVVRLLPRLSGSVTVPKDFPENIVDYSNVTLHHMPFRAGRTPFKTMLFDKRQGKTRNAFFREVANTINTRIPKGEAINLWTFKTRGGTRGNFIGKIREHLEKLGVDFDQTITINGEAKPRINILTWGMETATNRYSYAQHSVFLGVIHRDLLDIAAETLGDHKDLMLPDDNLSVAQDISASEAAHAVYQAASRSVIRHHHDGKADAGTIWLPIKTPGVINRLVAEALPGISVAPWVPEKADGWEHSESDTAKLARTIRSILRSLPNDVTRISASAVNKQLGEIATERKVKDAQAMLAKSPPDGWEKAGRSWVRCPTSTDILGEAA